MLPLGCFRSLRCSKRVFPQGCSEIIVPAKIQQDNKLKLTMLIKQLSYSLVQVFEAIEKKTPKKPKKQPFIFVNAVFLTSSVPYKSVLAFEVHISNDY